MSKQPTATAFTRTQESRAIHVLPKVRAQIEEREDWLREKGWKPDEFDTDATLMDLYDDELFYERYAAEMARQRAYIKEKYFND